MIVTTHAKKRVQSRVKVNAGMVSKIVQRAFKRGLKHNQTCGELRSFCDGLFLSQRNANNMRIYNKIVYLFRGTKLLTAIKLPNELIQIEQNIRHERKN